MLEESLRHRLEALNRGALPGVVPAATLPTRRAPVPPRRTDTANGGEPLAPRAIEVENARGRHGLVRIGVAEFWPSADRLLAGRHEFLMQSPCEGRCDEVNAFLSAFPHGFLGIDLETCGLGGSALFLVGLVRHEAGELAIELLLARNYAEEGAVLLSLHERLVKSTTLLTFNGKSFDWPMVGDRWRRYLFDRERPLPGLAHFDVLHHARRKWRRQLPNCKLQTLERSICRRSRTGDIAGQMIPATYEQYVRSGDPNVIEPVLYHNALDLVTLLDLAMRVAS